MVLPVFYSNLETNKISFAIVEWIGYIGRMLSSDETPNWTLGPYLLQTLLLLLAPALFAASIYILMGRIILVLQAGSHSLLRKNWLTKIFVIGDVLSFLIQSVGKLFIFISKMDIHGYSNIVSLISENKIRLIKIICLV